MNLINIAESVIGTAVGVGFVIFVIWVFDKIDGAIKKHNDKKYE